MNFLAILLLVLIDDDKLLIFNELENKATESGQNRYQPVANLDIMRL